MIDAKVLTIGFDAISKKMSENRMHLISIDQQIGDGDLGISMDNGFKAAADICCANADTADIGMLLKMLTSISDSPAVIMIMINLFMILLGMLMDDTSGVLLATPILLPIVTELGVSPIQFAAIVGVNLGMGNITPPTAPLLYLGGKISGAEVKEMLPHTMRLILFAWLPTLIITTYVPDLSLFLPRLFGYC